MLTQPPHIVQDDRYIFRLEAIPSLKDFNERFNVRFGMYPTLDILFLVGTHITLFT